MMGLPSVSASMGCDVKCADDKGFADAVTSVHEAEVVIAVVGLDQSQERSSITPCLSRSACA